MKQKELIDARARKLEQLERAIEEEIRRPAATVAPQEPAAAAPDEKARLLELQWKQEKERLLLQEQFKREEKEHEIVRLEKELELLQEERRAQQEAQARAEAAERRRKHDELEEQRDREAKLFEEAMRKQMEEKEKLEAEILRLLKRQKAVEEAQRREAMEQKAAAELARKQATEKKRAELALECLRLQQAKEARQRLLAAQHLDSARADELLHRRMKRDEMMLSQLGVTTPPHRKKKHRHSSGSPPRPISEEKTRAYLDFVGTLEKEQRKLLKKSGWDEDALLRLEACELTRRQIRSAPELAALGPAGGSVTKEQLRDLQELDQWQKWYMDSDALLDAYTNRAPQETVRPLAEATSPGASRSHRLLSQSSALVHPSWPDQLPPSPSYPPPEDLTPIPRHPAPPDHSILQPSNTPFGSAQRAIRMSPAWDTPSHASKWSDELGVGGEVEHIINEVLLPNQTQKGTSKIFSSPLQSLP